MRSSRSKSPRYFFAGHVSIFSSFSLSFVFIDFSIRNIDRYTSICGISERRGKNRLLTIDRAMKSENTDITCFFLREFSMIPYESTALCCIASSRSIYIYIYIGGVFLRFPRFPALSRGRLVGLSRSTLFSRRRIPSFV